MLTFCTLFSGSSGNCCFLSTERGAVLVDCGLSAKQTLEAAVRAGLDPSAISAILITHEHSDHIKGAGILSRKLHVPVFATGGTWSAMETQLGPLPDASRVVITAGESFYWNDVEILPFSIPHDAAEPVGYRFITPKKSVAIATDLGYFAPGVKDAITGADVVLLESNHDPSMLKMNPRYPQSLKTRILGKRGHLSNEDGSCAAVWLAQNGTRHLLLGHLSQENNTPDIAYRTCYSALAEAGAHVGEDVTLHVADRARAGFLYRL